LLDEFEELCVVGLAPLWRRLLLLWRHRWIVTALV
jgi:hypothetical protein